MTTTHRAGYGTITHAFAGEAKDETQKHRDDFVSQAECSVCRPELMRVLNDMLDELFEKRRTRA